MATATSDGVSEGAAQSDMKMPTQTDQRLHDRAAQLTRDVIDSDTVRDLPVPEQWQAKDVAKVLRGIGAYRGSESDAMTDAVRIVRALRYAPEGDNHHNAARCPYCSPKAANA